MDPTQLISDVNVADGEQIVLEFKIQFDINAAVPYVFAPKSEKRIKTFASKLPPHIAAVQADQRMMIPLIKYFEG